MTINVQMLKAGEGKNFELKQVEAEEIKSPWAGYRLFIHEAQDKEGKWCVTEYGSGFAVVHEATSKEAALNALKVVYELKRQDFYQCVKQVILNLGVANCSEDDDLF